MSNNETNLPSSEIKVEVDVEIIEPTIIDDDEDATGAYSKREIETLNFNAGVRQAMIQSITKDGMPTKVGDLRVLNEVLSSSDKAIHDTVNNRVKLKAAGSQQQTAELIAGLLARVSVYGNNNNEAINSATRQLALDTNDVPDTLVPGHTDINPEKLDPKTFINDGE